MAKLVPINYVSTTKQALFDIIVGRRIPEEAQSSNIGLLAAISPYLVKGDYETIYKMMVNREMILGATVECHDDGRQSIYQWGELDFVTGKTVGSKPVITFGNDDGSAFIDCNNTIYEHLDDIPFDAPMGGTVDIVVNPTQPGGDGK